MISRERAVEVVDVWLAEQMREASGSGQRAVWRIASMEECRFGWYCTYQTEKFLQSREPHDALIANPLLVDGDTATLYEIPTGWVMGKEWEADYEYRIKGWHTPDAVESAVVSVLRRPSRRRSWLRGFRRERTSAVATTRRVAAMRRLRQLVPGLSIAMAVAYVDAVQEGRRPPRLSETPQRIVHRAKQSAPSTDADGPMRPYLPMWTEDRDRWQLWHDPRSGRVVVLDKAHPPTPRAFPDEDVSAQVVEHMLTAGVQVVMAPTSPDVSSARWALYRMDPRDPAWRAARRRGRKPHVEARETALRVLDSQATFHYLLFEAAPELESLDVRIEVAAELLDRQSDHGASVLRSSLGVPTPETRRQALFHLADRGRLEPEDLERLSADPDLAVRDAVRILARNVGQREASSAVT